MQIEKSPFLSLDKSFAARRSVKFRQLKHFLLETGVVEVDTPSS